MSAGPNGKTGVWLVDVKKKGIIVRGKSSGTSSYYSLTFVLKVVIKFVSFNKKWVRAYPANVWLPWVSCLLRVFYLSLIYWRRLRHDGESSFISYRRTPGRSSDLFRNVYVMSNNPLLDISGICNIEDLYPVKTFFTRLT